MDKTIERAKVIPIEYVCKDGTGDCWHYINEIPFFSIDQWGPCYNRVQIAAIPERENVAPEDSLRRVV